MTDCFITRRGGGGSGGLNFEVVGGTTQPTNPKENTIWMNTDTDITEWVFSSAQPTGSDGMVWLGIGKASATSFNALKKNTLMVYPLFAQQYVGGAWEDMGAQIFQNSSWQTLWGGTLFADGNQYESITGGWYKYTGTGFDGSTAIIQDTITTTSPSGGSGGVGTRKKIDLTNFNTIRCEVTALNNNGAFLISGVNTGYLGEHIVAFSEFISVGTKTMDISNLSGEYYVYLTTGNGGSCTFSRVELLR